MPTLVQWIHVTASIISVGGLAFLLFILEPSLEALPPEQREPFTRQVMNRFRWVVSSSIVLLLLSGVYSVRQSYWEAPWGKAWALLTVKIVLSFFVFVIALGVTLPVKIFDRPRARRRTWLAIAVGLAAVVILLAAYLPR